MTLQLEPDLDLAAARRLKAALLAALAEEAPLSLDGARVERIGTPAIQVILAAAERSAAEGRALSITHASQSLRAAFADLGLAPVLAAMEAAL